MDKNLKGELAIMDSMNLKPNYTALGRKYGLERIGNKDCDAYENKFKD